VKTIDSHLHVWDPSRFRYEWLDDLPPLNRGYGFDELRAEQQGGTAAPNPAAPNTDAPDGYVFVQADCSAEQSYDEAAWVSELAATEPIVGIVAAASLESGDAVAPALERLRELPLVVGVRRLLQQEPLGFALGDGFLAGARALAAAGLSFDAGVTHRHLPDVVALVDAVPDLVVVLDHFGKPDVASADPAAFAAWRNDLAQLASRPAVSCKFSGLPPQAGTPDWTAKQFTPYFDTALEFFGADRCLFGSDWPASSLQTGYTRWLDFVREWAAPLSEDERIAIFSGTATSVYRLDR
jgi:L-fuconolactonase